jgi:signal peptidase
MGESTLIKNNKVKKILNITFYVVLFIVFVYAIFGLFSEKDENSISFLGITSMSVQSDSMSPTFDKGDLIFVDTDFNPEDLLPGDVITYRKSEVIEGNIVYYYNTHRIDQKIDYGTRIQFITKGDNEDQTDPFIWEDDIYAVWTGKSVANFGGFVDGFTA